MRYLPKSPADRRQMLDEIGVASIDDLFSTIPGEYRLNRDLALPFPQLAESEIIEYFRKRSDECAAGYANFLGAGAYQHYRPVVIDALVQRGEFLTSYTPYQAEIAQGTLQAIFEFQTMICELTGMDLANASMYEGSTGAAEAVMMACRISGRSHAVLARSVHPEYREVVNTYLQHQDIGLSEIGYGEDGRVDMAALEQSITDSTACVLIQSPNFFGCIEDVAAVADLVHRRGALLIVSIAEALSLGIVKAPAEADIVSLEAQSFGVALSYGGPYCGVLAAKEKFIRQMPGRLVGETKDRHGRRGFVLTLSTREQHIRREKATSNICTNQALVALMATIYMTVYGKQGLKDLAKQNLSKAHYAARRFAEKGKLRFSGTPFFNEFVIEGEEKPDDLNERLLQEKIVGGLPLARFYPELGNAALWCCTELNSREQIDRAAAVMTKQVLHEQREELVRGD